MSERRQTEKSAVHFSTVVPDDAVLFLVVGAVILGFYNTSDNIPGLSLKIHQSRGFANSFNHTCALFSAPAMVFS